MATCFDAAKYILKLQAKIHNEETITTWKLQKLAYYSQAWATVWDEEPIFGNAIEAWANGPVIRVLYNKHRGKFKISLGDISNGKIGNIISKHKDTIEAIVEAYGNKTSQYLSELTHKEPPWIDARKGLAMGERGNSVITLNSMAEYYGGLFDDEAI